MEQLLHNYFRFVRRLLPEEKGITKVGLDIGVNSCKYMALARVGDQYEVQGWGIEPIAGDGLVPCLKTLAAKLNLPHKSPVSSISGKGTLIRYIDMPRMSLDELKKSFSIEVDKYFPFDQNTIYTDCSILDPKSKDKKMAVLIAAVKKEMVDERLQALTAAGFEPQQVTINAIAVANAFQILGSGGKASEAGADKSKSHAKAILDIGDSVSNLMILKDGVPRFTRDIFIGSQEITKRIMNAFGVNAEEAEKLKHNPGEQSETLFNACESTVMNWISEIRLSLDYFITEKNTQVDMLFLTGGGSMMPNLENLFEKNLDLTVRKWNFLSDLSFAPGVVKEEVAKHAPRLSVAMGLALSQYD